MMLDGTGAMDAQGMPDAAQLSADQESQGEGPSSRRRLIALLSSLALLALIAVVMVWIVSPAASAAGGCGGG